jgi:hypothetical protein
MIVVNIDKARAIAHKLAEQVKEATMRTAYADAIAQADTMKALAAVVEKIKAGEPVQTTVENTAESAEGGSASVTA